MEDEKLSGRVIIDTILANMRQQVEELRYSKVVPAAYDVYLHTDDQQRFESLAHEIAAEAVRALQERLDALNRPSRLDRVRERVGKPRLPFKKVGPWVVRITRDPEAAVPRGRALVVSQITLAGAESFEGQRTRRLATLSEPSSSAHDARDVARDVASHFDPAPHLGPASGASPGAAAAPRAASDPLASQAQSRPEAPRSPAGPSAPLPHAIPISTAALADTRVAEHADTHEMPRAPALALLGWTDETGSHVFRMTRLEMTVGRAVLGSTADVQLATLPDVSRTHVRVRYHPDTRRFSIEDLSLLGTTVNGEALVRGAPRDLPSPADIRLADTITLRWDSGELT